MLVGAGSLLKLWWKENLQGWQQIHYKTGAKANSAQERGKEKSIRDRGKTQGERAGDEEETDWEEAGKERREDA